MKVGMDVSALAQTRAGTARYVRGLLRELPEVRRLSFGGAGRGSTLARELVWYPAVLPWADVDVLHCPTYRGPLRSRAPTTRSSTSARRAASTSRTRFLRGSSVPTART